MEPLKSCVMSFDAMDTNLVDIEKRLREEQHEHGVPVIMPPISRPFAVELKVDIEERRQSLLPLCLADPGAALDQERERWKEDDQARTLGRLADGLLTILGGGHYIARK